MQALEIEDLYKQAKKRVPKMFFEYVDTGSWTGSTYKANFEDFKKINFRQRVAIDLTNRNIRSKLIGQDVSMPIALAPIGLCGMQYADGEILAAKAAEDFGVPFTLSTMSVCSIEDVKAKTKKPFWFQLYLMRDRKFIENLIIRAKKAECSALMLTLDLPVMGQRHADIRNGLTAPPELNFKNAIQILSKLNWCMNMLTTRKYTFRNIVGHATDVTNLSSLAAWTKEQFDPTLSWADIKWIRKLWPGKLILKGIMDVEDAKLASKNGADAIIVSNHGGRQLDGAPSTISCLEKIVDSVGTKVEVHFDGGIKSGQDVLKALSLGAKGVYIGRAFVYGLGASGYSGVKRSLEIIQNELDMTMAFCGIKQISEIGKHNIISKL